MSEETVIVGKSELERLRAIEEDEAFRRRVVEVVVGDIKSNGPIRMALVGL